MPSTSIFIGGLLMLIGAIGYVYGAATGKASLTALIPAVFGLLLFLLVSAARAKENLTKHLMHVAVLIALLGFLASAGRIFSKIAEFSLSVAAVSQILMAVLCLIFVILAVRSFIDARKNNV
ncbi:MAG: hypothetical protein KIS76_05515 [Pyrinomonadaceae bacterium]|nr:hypothetical protein [Pyrinomonadaceae bacterium]